MIKNPVENHDDNSEFNRKKKADEIFVGLQIKATELREIIFAALERFNTFLIERSHFENIKKRIAELEKMLCEKSIEQLTIDAQTKIHALELEKLVKALKEKHKEWLDKLEAYIFKLTEFKNKFMEIYLFQAEHIIQNTKNLINTHIKDFTKTNKDESKEQISPREFINKLAEPLYEDLKKRNITPTVYYEKMKNIFEQSKEKFSDNLES